MTLLALAVLIGSGVAAEIAYASMVARYREVFEAAAARGREAWLQSTFAVLALNLLGITAFAGGYAIAFLTFWHASEARRQLAATVLVGVLAVRLTQCVVGFLLSPRSMGDRILPLSQAGARHFYNGLVRTAVLGALAGMGAHLLGAWSDDIDLRRMLLSAVVAVVFGYAATIYWIGGRHLSDGFRSRRKTAARASRHRCDTHTSNI